MLSKDRINHDPEAINQIDHMSEETTIKILGVNDDVNTCDCCGKTNLKKVVWLEINEADPVAYGTSCAARTIGLKGRYTASTADKLVRDYSAREERRARLNRSKEFAQKEADKTGKEIGVFRSRDGQGFYTYPIESAYTGHMAAMRGYPVATFTPEERIDDDQPAQDYLEDFGDPDMAPNR